jgi:WD40 repeat protein
MLDVAFSPDGQQLAASGADGSVRLWDMNNINAPSWMLKLDQTGWTQAVTYSPNGLQIATGGNDRIVRIADADGYSFAQFSGHEGFIFGLDYTPDSLQLVSGDGDGMLMLWNIASGGLLSATTVGKSAIRDLDFSPKQEFLAIANATDGFKLLAYPSLRQICAFDGVSVLTTAVSNDNASIMLGTEDGLLIRIDPNCTIMDRTPAHNGAVNSVAFSSRGSMMVSGGSDGVVFVMPGAISLRGHTDSVESVAINPAGTLIASASADGTIILWGVPSE